MKKINKTTMMIFALVLSLSVVIGTSLAYFSDYEEAAGAATLSLGGQTKLYEGEDTDKKEIVVTNTGKTEMIVRVAVFGPDEMFSNSNPSYNSADWEKVGNYYYYKHVLKPDPEGKGNGESTSPIVAKLEFSWGPQENPQAPDYDFEVTVVHEGSQALYKGDTLIVPDGWDSEGVAAISVDPIEQ